MKEFLGNILEPGETLVWRDPPGSGLFLAIFATLQPALIVLMITMFGRGAENVDAMWRAFWLFLTIGPLYGIIFYLSGRWKIAVTDRRVMHRKGLWRTGYEEIRRDAIEDVRNDIPTVVLRSGDREMRVEVGGESHYLHALLTGTGNGAAAAKLLPGETVTLCMPGRWRPWRVMVTDRRVIHRLSSYPTRILQMRLDEIEAVYRDTVFHAVLLRGAGRELAIRLGVAEAASLLDALDRPAWDDPGRRERDDHPRTIWKHATAAPDSEGGGGDEGRPG